MGVVAVPGEAAAVSFFIYLVSISNATILEVTAIRFR